jgi:FtsH-binding integral membrane protein
MESISAKQTQVQVRVNEFIRSVYNWMAIGLALTGFVAFYVSNTPALLNLILGNRSFFSALLSLNWSLCLQLAPVSIGCRLQPPPLCLFSMRP